jgi:predicted ABC-type transport system involved in lysophospholipase L1 biosynthesis ATPase subunit
VLVPMEIAGARHAPQRARTPPVLLADEPTGNLDTATGRQIIDLLLSINRDRGTTLVLVTHDPDLARVADTAVALRDGRVVAREEQNARVRA